MISAVAEPHHVVWIRPLHLNCLGIVRIVPSLPLVLGKAWLLSRKGGDLSLDSASEANDASSGP